MSKGIDHGGGGKSTIRDSARGAILMAFITMAAVFTVSVCITDDAEQTDAATDQQWTLYVIRGGYSCDTKDAGTLQKPYGSISDALMSFYCNNTIGSLMSSNNPTVTLYLCSPFTETFNGASDFPDIRSQLTYLNGVTVNLESHDYYTSEKKIVTIGNNSYKMVMGYYGDNGDTAVINIGNKVKLDISCTTGTGDYRIGDCAKYNSVNPYTHHLTINAKSGSDILFNGSYSTHLTIYGSINCENGSSVTQWSGNMTVTDGIVVDGKYDVIGRLYLEGDSILSENGYLGVSKALHVYACTFTQTGGTLNIGPNSDLVVQGRHDNSDNLIKAANLVSDGTVYLSRELYIDGASVEFNGSVSVDSGSSLVGSFTRGGTLDVNGSFDVEGTVNMPAATFGSDSMLTVAENGELTAGDLTLVGTTAISGTATLTKASVGGTLTVEETGKLTVKELTLGGTADISGTATLDEAVIGGTFTVEETGKLTAKTVTVSDGGKLEVDGNLTVPAGKETKITVEENAEFVTNGTLDVKGTADIDGKATIGKDAVVTIYDGGELTTDDVTLGGSLVVEEGSTFTSDGKLDMEDGSSFTADGDINLSDSSNMKGSFEMDSFTLVSGKNLTISGEGSVATFTNVVTVESGSTLTVENGGRLVADTVVVEGTLRISGADASSFRNLTVSGADAVVEFFTTLFIPTGSEYKVQEGALSAETVVIAGKLTSSENGKISAGAVGVYGGTLDVSGTSVFSDKVIIGVTPGTIAALEEDITGTAVVSGTATFNGAVTVNYGSVLRVGSNASIIANSAIGVQGTMTVSDDASISLRDILVGMSPSYVKGSGSAVVDLGSSATGGSFSAAFVVPGSQLSFNTAGMRSTQFIDDIAGEGVLCFTAYAGSNATTLISSVNGTSFNKDFGRWYDLTGESTSVPVGKLEKVYMAPAGTSDVVITPSKGFKSVTIGDETWEAEAGESHSFYVYPGETAVVCKVKSEYTGKIKLTNTDTGARLLGNKIVTDAGQTYRYDASVGLTMEDDIDDWIPSEESEGLDTAMIVAAVAAILLLTALMMLVGKRSARSTVTFYSSVGGKVSDQMVKVPRGTVMTFRGRNAVLKDDKGEVAMITARPDAGYRFASWSIYDNGGGSWLQNTEERSFVILDKIEIDVMFLEGESDGLRASSEEDRVTIIKGARDPYAVTERQENRVQEL